MNKNPLVGYIAIAPDGAFFTIADFVLVFGVSRKGWLRTHLDSSGMRLWQVMPVFVNYLYPVIESGVRGAFAFDGESFRIFDPLATARSWQPSGSFLSEFEGEGVQHTFIVYSQPVGLN